MAIYQCDCGLTISTSSVRPRCLRCLRVLVPELDLRGLQTPVVEIVVAGIVARPLPVNLAEHGLPVPAVGKSS